MQRSGQGTSLCLIEVVVTNLKLLLLYIKNEYLLNSLLEGVI